MRLQYNNTAIISSTLIMHSHILYALTTVYLQSLSTVRPLKRLTLSEEQCVDYQNDFTLWVSWKSLASREASWSSFWAIIVYWHIQLPSGMATLPASRKSNNRVMRAASRAERDLPSVDTFYVQSICKIVTDKSYPVNGLFCHMPSGFRYRCAQVRTSLLQKFLCQSCSFTELCGYTS